MFRSRTNPRRGTLFAQGARDGNLLLRLQTEAGSPGEVHVRRRHRPKVRDGVHRLGAGGDPDRALGRADARGPRAVIWHSPNYVRTTAAAPHQCRDLRVRGQRHLRGRLLLESAPAQSAHVQRRAIEVPLLGLAGHHRLRGAHAPDRYHSSEGVRGARVAHRHRHRRGVGRFRGQLLRDDRQAPRAPHLRRDLVLHRDDHHGRHPPHLQQPGDSCWVVQELLALCRRTGRVHAVVVRPQRRRVLPDHAVPRA